MIPKKLIIDCGSHIGQDSQFYLSRGYEVYAIDASPSLVERLKNIFKEEIEEGNFHIKNIAVGNKSGKVSFFESKDCAWNSTKLEIANRNGYLQREIIIDCLPLSDIILEYGKIPYYIKIDLEGNDYDAIMSLKNIDQKFLPQYISCETECVGENEIITEEEALKTLEALKEVGYTKFKLVSQNPLCPVTLQNFKSLTTPTYLSNFVFGSSGPFGEEITTDWLSYEPAKNILTTYRKWFFSSKKPNYSFWCDFHATK